MNFFYANGTPIINSLKVTSEVPLDPRLTVENIAERDSLVTNHISYDRMKVYVKSNDTKYIYHKDTGEWEIDNKFSEEDKSKLDRIDNYLIDTEHIYNPENKLLYREHSYDPNTDIATLRDHILQEARVDENGELYNGLLSKFYVNRLNNITNYLIDVSFTKGTDVPNLYLTTHSYNPDKDKTTLTNIDIPLATDDNNGLLSNLQNIKINRIVDYVNKIDTTHTNAPDTGLTYNYNIYNPFTNANVTKTILIPLVTHIENGLTSSSDKIKIDDIETYVKSMALRQASGTEELGIDYIITNPNDQTDTPGYFNIPLVTDTRNGLVSPARKHWMDNANGVSNTGTASDTWQLDKKDINTRLDPNGGVIIKDSGGIAEIRNNTDSEYSDLTLNNITIKGNVTQEGKSFITEAETVEVRDNTLLLNRGETGAGVSREFAGIEIDRGTEPKYQILFDESDDRFKVGKEGDLWCVTLRDDEADMEDGMFTTWDASTKRLKTTNIVPANRNITFANGKDDGWSYSLKINENSGYLSIETFWHTLELDLLGSDFATFDLTKVTSNHRKFKFLKPIISDTIECTDSNYIEFYSPNHMGRDRELVLQLGYSKTRFAVSVYGTTFYRTSDNSEVLYHADIVNNLTSGGVNKVLSAEQGKLLNNAIEDIRGTYLPLTGGTMTGSIIFPNRKGIFGRLTDGTGNIKIAVVNANNNVEIGSSNIPLMLVSNSTDLTHYRDNNTYKIWDKFNLSDPATLSGNNTFTGNNTFQAGKFSVGPFGVTSSGSLLLNINSQEGSAWSRSITFRANSDSTSSSVFGGYNSIDNTSIGYAYIGIGDVNYSTAQYKFYAHSLRVPYQWSIDGPDGAAIIWSQTSEIVNLGRAAGTTKIRSGNTDLIHTKGSTEYIIWDKSNLPTPASTTDLTNYLPLTGGTLTGQLTIKQSVDIKLRLQSTDADNYCIIQAINAQASQLGVFGYAGDKWAIGHGGTYYEIWDKYNLANPVTYIADENNYATLKNKDGNNFTYIKTGVNGILPSTAVNLTSGGYGGLGSNNWSFDAGYINHLHTNKISFGTNGAFIDNRSGDSSRIGIGFYTPQNAACPVYVGSLCVSDGYANSAPNIPANGIYSKGNIRTGSAILFLNNTWTNDLAPNRNSAGYLQVLDAYDASSDGGPTNYGTVLQINSRISHWANQLWFSSLGLYHRHMAYNQTEYSDWTKLATTSDLNSYLTKTEASTLYYPYNGRGYLSITSSGRPVMSNNQGYAVKDKDGNEKEVLWMGTDNVLRIGNTSQYTLDQLDLRCITLTHNGSSIATQPYVTNQLANYLPLSGGTITSSGLNPVYINSTSNQQSALIFHINSSLSAAVGGNKTLGAFLQDGSGAILTVKSDGAYYGVNTSSPRKLATVTDLAGYLPLSGGTMSGNISFNGDTGHIVVGTRETSNYVSAVSFNKGSATNSAHIGYHSTGGSDSSGALVLVPYPTSANPWAKAVGLYIAKNELLLDGKAIATQEYVTWNNVAGKPTIYERTIGINGTYWSFYAPTNATSAMIYGPTSAGTSGQILQSTGGVPTWVNASSVVGNFVSKSGDTMTGALTMNSRRNNIVVDVVGGAGNSWDEGAGALSIQVPNDSGQTPLILARRSGAAINTTVATERLLSMELLDTGHSFIIGMSGSEALQLDWTSGKAGTGKLFGKTIATTDQIPSLSGYATQSWANSQFAPLKNYFVTSNYASIATTGNEMCIGSLTSGNSVINVNYRNGTGTTSPSTWYWRAGSSTTWANAYWGNLYMNNNLVATQSWASGQFPTKTGIGASGTWDISISGNASTATTATKWNGYSIWTGTEDELPSSRDANTLYFVKKS